VNAEVGQPVVATLVDPGSLLQGEQLGARIEVPVTRAIVSYWRLAVFDGGATYTVTLDSPPDPGAYELVWRTGDAEPPAYETYVPLFVSAAGTVTASGTGGATIIYPLLVDNVAEFTPTADDVAALERTRTFDDNGDDQGTFNGNTKPSDTDVDKLIEQAIEDIYGELPIAVDPTHYPTIKRAVTLHAAVLVEGSFFRDDVNTDAVNLYRGLAKDALAGVEKRTAIEEVAGVVRLV
jgi:hypothetical protein